MLSSSMIVSLSWAYEADSLGNWQGEYGMGGVTQMPVRGPHILLVLQAPELESDKVSQSGASPYTKGRGLKPQASYSILMPLVVGWAEKG